MKYKLIFLLPLFLFFTEMLLKAQKKKVYNLVKDFGARPDDKTDCYPALYKAAAALSKAGGGTLRIPKGKYYLSSYKITGGAQKNEIFDIVFKNCNGLVIQGNNSIIRMNGKFTRNADFQIPGLPYQYAYNNTVCPFKITNCKDVVIKDLTLYGEVDKMRKQKDVIEGQCYGVFIADEEPGDTSSRVVLQNITAHHFAADGFTLKSNGYDIVISNCRSYNNARQGISIVKGNDIKCLHSVFDSTGHTGAYGWHAPGAGIDVENEFGPGYLNNVLIQNCTMRGNNGFQVITTVPTFKVVIDSCFISDLTGGYSYGTNGVGMFSLNSVLSNSILFATIQVEVADQLYKGEYFQTLSKNLIYSGHRGIVTSGFSRPINILDNFFIMLPNPQLDTYFPYVQNEKCRFNRNIIVTHADRIKQEPDRLQVTALVQAAIETKDVFWLINGYDIPAEKRKKNYYQPALNGTAFVQNQFFPVNDIADIFDVPQKKSLPPAQVSKLLTAGFITAYKQKAFDKTFLVQAETVRKYAATIVAAAK